ncbi:MAG: imidazole glycerol phosphate synthase subunit HisH, partial [Candidatus Omnitrophota bacterium]
LEVRNSEKIILPGVGNFAEASKRMFASGIADVITDSALRQNKPLLGICLGMQLLAQEGEEGGGAPGLGLIAGRVTKICLKDPSLRLPHIGWNDVSFNGMKLFSGIEEGASFYFVHSFEMVPDETSIERATTRYGSDIVAAVRKDHVLGVQFHPEKSQKDGLRLLTNFVKGLY